MGSRATRGEERRIPHSNGFLPAPGLQYLVACFGAYQERAAKALG